MLWNTRWALVPLVCLGGLVLGSTAHADKAVKPVTVYTVRDDGEMFKSETLTKANEVIKDIAKRLHTEVLIETSKTPPAADIARVKALDPEGRDRYFHDAAVKRARERRVEGVYVLINRSPSHIQIEVAQNRLESFTQVDARKLRDKMKEHFNNKELDAGLLAGVNFIQERLSANPPRAAVPAASNTGSRQTGTTGTTGATSSDTGWSIGGIICVGLVVLLVIWLIVGLIRAFTAPAGGGGGPGGAPGYGYGGGGGGFLTGLLGGLFGAMAGNWLYHNMFGGGSSWGNQAYGSTPGAGPDAGAGSQPQDYTGAGGSWGEDTGGGDAGGGDAGGGGGGGDWGGGGDFGGGGGDWGGGGGDFGGGGDWGGGGGDFGGGGGGDW